MPLLDDDELNPIDQAIVGSVCRIDAQQSQAATGISSDPARAARDGERGGK